MTTDLLAHFLEFISILLGEPRLLLSRFELIIETCFFSVERPMSDDLRDLFVTSYRQAESVILALFLCLRDIYELCSPKRRISVGLSGQLFDETLLTLDRLMRSSGCFFSL